MGAPKQKWTPEEEAALKAGIKKHGVGKWSTILRDPEFYPILCARSNVDLKDKFRNLNCLILGSRQKSKKKEESSSVREVVVVKDSELLDQASLETSCKIFQGEGSRKPISRVDVVILEAITKLKEPRGSKKASILQFITDNYSATPDLEKILAANLKEMTKSGRLFKVKNQYRIAPKKVSFSLGKEPMLLEAGPTTEDPPEEMENEFVLLTKAMVDAELENMRRMSPEEAAKAAMIAVAEAEAAMAAAEAAAKDADEAEAEAEVARSFAAAAEKALNFQGFHVR